MAKKNIEYVVSGPQFTEMVHRATQATRHGDDPLKHARKLMKSWHRLNTITEQQASERERRILSDALMAGSAVLRDAASVASNKAERHRLKAQQVSLKLDSVQAGLHNSLTDLSRLQQATADVIEGTSGVRYADVAGARSEHSNQDLFLALNARALNLQVQVERARELSSGRRSAVANTLQSSLADLTHVSAGHLARLGNLHAESVAEGKVASAAMHRGVAAELAFFTRHLVDWHENGVMHGNNVRLASIREDQPHLRTDGLRLGFDAVVSSPAHDSTSYAQVKTSKHIGGFDYVEEIDLWRPADPDFMSSAIESSLWFSEVVDRNTTSSVAAAQRNIVSTFGEPIQLRVA